MGVEFHLLIIKPDGYFWDNKVEKIIFSTNTGLLTILANHRPLITMLYVGVLEIFTKTKKIPFTIMGGLLFIKKNKVTILINEIFSKDNLNFSDVELLYDKCNKAKKQINNLQSKNYNIDLILQSKRVFAQYKIFTGFKILK